MPLPPNSSQEQEAVMRYASRHGDHGKLIRSDAYLPQELVGLLGLILYNEPPATIAQRCEQIAQAYRERPAPNALWDADRHEIITLLTQEADRFRRKANPSSPLSTIGGDDRLRGFS
jgi:hypothetical protein